MGFEHKAFRFDWDAFHAGLAPLMKEALAEDDVEALREFIDANLGACSNPYDGERLSPGWETAMAVGDAQEFADFALTKYYRPDDDLGIGDSWLEIEAALSPQERQALLGRPFGSPEKLFDPGRQGSYFKTPPETGQSLQQLSASGLPVLREFCERLKNIAAAGKGLYVTF